MHELVLLGGNVVGLQSRGCDLDCVAEYLLALLDLLNFVGNGLLFVLDLHNGVD